MSALSHPDYPIYISGSIGFLWRLFHTSSPIVPYAITFFVTLCIPAIIYLDIYRKNLVIVALVLFLFSIDEFYLLYALAQYSNAPLALLFLSALICLHYISENRKLVAVVAALLGCCMWTKNEGEMLALISILFNVRLLFSKGNWKYFIAGIILPVFALLVFKYGAPVNDLMTNQGNVWIKLKAGERYEIIWNSLCKNLNINFFMVKAGLILYAILCVVEKKMPDRNMWMLLCCTAGFFFVYVLTNKDLAWHLESSMDRVLLQLMPAFMYVIASRLSSVRFVLTS